MNNGSQALQIAEALFGTNCSQWGSPLSARYDFYRIYSLIAVSFSANSGSRTPILAATQFLNSGTVRATT